MIAENGRAASNPSLSSSVWNRGDVAQEMYEQ